MQTVTNIACGCPRCDWVGCVGDCYPDIDDDGSLGCPHCLAVVNIDTPSAPKNRPLTKKEKTMIVVHFLVRLLVKPLEAKCRAKGR